MDTELSLPKKILVTLVVIGCILLTGGILYNYYPIGVDWDYTFSRLRLIDPYSVEHFINPPFTMLFLANSFLPIRLGNTINIILNISVILYAVRKLGGDWKSVGLIFTSPVFLIYAGQIISNGCRFLA